MNPELKFTFHKSFDGYLAKLDIPESVIKKSQASQPDFVLLLDRSGSMGQNVNRIITKILPKTLEKLGYKQTDTVHIILYDYPDKETTITQYYYYSNIDRGAEYEQFQLKELLTSNITARGCTNLGPGLRLLPKVFSNLSDKVRLLHISDGQIQDMDDAVKCSEQIHKIITNGRQINSQAIRYMTGGQPDTRGLSSTLKFGNTVSSKLLDVPYVSDEIGFNNAADKIFQQFDSDGLSYKIELKTDSEYIMTNPWEKPVSYTTLSIGQNTLWFKEMPKTIGISGVDAVLKPEAADNVNLSNVTNIIDDRLNYYVDRIRILKIVNTDDSKAEISNILTYFEQFQNYLNTLEIVENPEYTPDLKFRFNSIKRNIEQRRKSLFMKLQQLANDDIVSQLNSAQQADYLRGVDLSKNSKGLAKRAMKTGFDLTNVIHNEIKAIHQHIKELDSIDDSEHLKSFYSVETTLEGLKTLSQLVEDNLLDETSVSDIIQLTNIVGIGCHHPIGDYPDAMAFRVHDIFPGVYISVSDITVYQTMAANTKLKVPGQPDKEINNVIPVFDDERIHKFMLKYCPMLLNVTAGVGMRRVLADVPSTHMYSICAGLWKTIDMFTDNRSELMMKTIKLLADTYNIDAGGYFDHNEEFLVDQNTRKSYFINNNGLTNMLNLIHRQYKKKNTNNMPKIIRAIYCYEFYQTIKKAITKADLPQDYINETLTNLLGLDYEKYGTKVGDLFTETPKPNHDTTVNVNTEVLNNIIYNFQYFKNLYMVPLVFEALEAEGNYLENMKNIPKASDQLLLKQIDVPYDLEQFLVYSVVESMIYNTKQKRVSDKSKKQMNLPDIGYTKEAKNMLKGFIVDNYQKSYNASLRDKTGKEYEVTLQEMNKKLEECNIQEFIEIMKKGFTYKTRSCQIVNTSSQGFNELGQMLLDTDKNIPNRFQKIWVYILAKTPDNEKEIVWNGGNAIRVDLRPYQYVFEHFNQRELWETLNNEYNNSVKHVYRGGKEKANRHGHHNQKPSYWALGFDTVKDMKSKVSEEEYLNYVEIHHECCGFNPVSLYQRKKMARKKRAESGSKTLNYY